MPACTAPATLPPDTLSETEATGALSATWLTPFALLATVLTTTSAGVITPITSPMG